MSQHPLRTRWAKPKTEAEQVDLLEQSMTLRAQGLTYSEIGRIMGCGKRTAQRRVQRGYDRRLKEPTDLAIKLEEDRLDRQQRRAEESILRLDKVIARFGALALRGDLDAAKLLVAAEASRAKQNATQAHVSESRRKLLGLDAPEKHEHSGAVSVGPTILIPAERPDDAAADPAETSASGRLAPEPGPPN